MTLVRLNSTFSRWMLCCFAIALIGFTSNVNNAQAAESATATATAFEWVPSDGNSIELRFQDKPVIRYMHEALDESSKESRARTYKPYHHVFSPDGSQLLTKGPGGLYPHHRGIYFGFNKITYGDGKRCDTWHCTGKAFESHEEVVSKSANDKGAAHTVSINWHGKNGEVFANEQRTIAVIKKEGGTQIDFSTILKSTDGKTIHLDGDPQHAGVQFRASQELAEKTKDKTYYVRKDGKGELGETRNYNHKKPNAEGNEECTNRGWNAMSFVVGGNRYTALYMDHSKNPKPARYSERDYGRFGSYFVADVTEEKPLTLHYRYWIQDGEMTIEECKAKFAEFDE